MMGMYTLLRRIWSLLRSLEWVDDNSNDGGYDKYGTVVIMKVMMKIIIINNNNYIFYQLGHTQKKNMK